MLNRAILIVLDSVGVGNAPDAAAYGDEGANTVGHIAQRTTLNLPHMNRLGFAHIPGTNLTRDPAAAGAYGCMTEASSGKDTTTGHWEIAGLKLEKPFPTYPHGFPAEVMDAFSAAIGRGWLGNKPASGTAILDELGEEHMRTGKVIVYTSGDSVFQIAAHEDIVPVEELYDMCRKARAILQGPHAVGRVIARSFTGTGAGHFTRTPRRHDFSLEPTGVTMLDQLKAAGLDTLAVGKIEDIFCHRGIDMVDHTKNNHTGIEATRRLIEEGKGAFIFTNLVDTDMLYGHRRDVEGYARALEYFDARLPELVEAMGAEDILMITADHGCDPTYAGTDHTREYIPLLVLGQPVKPGVDLGVRKSFCDIASTVYEYLTGTPWTAGTSFLSEMLR